MYAHGNAVARFVDVDAVVLLDHLDGLSGGLYVVLDVQAIVFPALDDAFGLEFTVAAAVVDPHPLQADEVVLVAGQAEFFGHTRPERVDVADEVGHEFRCRVVVDLVGRTDLLDAALVEHGNAVGEGQRLLLVVGDVDRGDAEFPLHLLQLVAQLHPQLGVQVGQRLVHADDGRLGHQGAGDGHALLLAAGELGYRLGQLLVGQVDLPCDGVYLFLDFRLIQLLDLQAECDVVPHRHRGKQGVALEHDADVALLYGHAGDVLPLHVHAAGRGLDEPGDGAQRGGLAAAGGPQEGEELPLLHVNVDGMQRYKIIEFDHDVLQLDHAHRSFSGFASSYTRAGAPMWRPWLSGTILSLGCLLGQGRPIQVVPVGLVDSAGAVGPEEAQVGHNVGPLGGVGAHVLGVGHIGALHLVQREVRDRVDRGHLVEQLGDGVLVAGIAVELVGPFDLDLSGAEPLGESLDGLGLRLGAVRVVDHAQVLGDVIGAVVDVHKRPVFGLQRAVQRVGLGAGLLGGLNVAVQGGGVEGGNLYVAADQRIQAVFVVREHLAVGAVGPQGLPAVQGDAAGGRGGIGKGVQQRVVGVHVGSAAHLVLAVPGVPAVHDVSPVGKVQCLALGAQLVVAVQHQYVLDDQAVGLAVILVSAHLVGPGGGPVHHGQVVIGAVHQLGPADLVQAEDDVGVLVLVGGLNGGSVAGDDGVVVQGDGEAGVSRGIHQPCHALGGIGIGVDADRVVGIILGGSGNRHQGKGQGCDQQQGQEFLH